MVVGLGCEKLIPSACCPTTVAVPGDGCVVRLQDERHQASRR